jgi:hypothetical protein
MKDEFECLFTVDQEEWLVDKLTSTITWMEAEARRLHKKKRELHEILLIIREKTERRKNNA